MSFFYSPTSALNITRCVVLDVMADALAGKNPAVLKDPFAKRLTSSCTHRAAISKCIPHHGYPTHVPTLTIF
ncbi:hypothetical protein PAPYR_12385 [Paratrimastix pyriformis]|uniref:Uncharacterized protein n=1 Tax=Paratrimastix pyriformis TaxID=342808 RepID=A0ABQ8U4I5_9EUKA|nr:hypothetical protein PAPYR_12385 [Paratrimastix pyriformis]